MITVSRFLFDLPKLPALVELRSPILAKLPKTTNLKIEI